MEEEVHRRSRRAAANYLVQSSSRSAELLMPREISKRLSIANAFGCAIRTRLSFRSLENYQY